MVLIATILVSFQLISVQGALSALVVSALLSLLALTLAIYGLARIWDETGKGTLDALVSIVWVLPVLGLAAGIAYAVTQTTSYADLATDVNNPPTFSALSPDEPGVMTLDGATVDERIRLQLEFPDLEPVYVERPGWHVAEVIETLRENRGWRLARRQQVSDQTFETEFAMSGPVPFLPYNVSVRVVDDGVGSLINARSISNLPLHDFGTNARALRGFLNQLALAIEATRPPASDL